MAHGIFPTTNKYYRASEIFPYLSKAEKKEVFFSTKSNKKVSLPKTRNDADDEQFLKKKR